MTKGVDAVPSDGLTVGAAASLVGVTVRTLHHWDAMGLVSPSERTAGGYRLYSATDIARIHRVLIYRELGLPLDGIADLLEAPATEPLVEQRAQLVERISRLQEMVAAVDRLIEAKNAGLLLTAEEQVAIFGRDWQPSWVAGARERWGETDQWAQYAERSAEMTTEDWKQVAASISTLDEDLAAAKRAGVVAGSTEGNALAERHRASIGAFFDCTHSMHVCLGRKYVADAGFTAHYDAFEPGLTLWLRDLINANAVANGIDPETATWS
ncbi:MerR family transcriptional regulator [Kribbella voronezhensis]|uniref:MerR family transcriptional regulator n=1 Tax=Kribbella voronezhensis TaxID=2512212 RepID=UPI001EDEFB8C|nr:MerR family transcriptional regulator [Kribbella voronezhensis]